MKGGYQIIDLKGLNLETQGGVHIKGVFAKAKSKKAILFENLNAGGDKIGGVFGYVIAVDENTFTATAGPVTLTITSSDVVAVVEGVTNKRKTK
jgi:preprotein translocase subunit YajC